VDRYVLRRSIRAFRSLLYEDRGGCGIMFPRGRGLPLGWPTIVIQEQEHSDVTLLCITMGSTLWLATSFGECSYTMF
jgi:hypothetical protein